jgi:uncharacterized protein Veg
MDILNTFFQGVSKDAIASIITSIIVFSLGFASTLLYDHHKEEKRLKELREYFFNLCEFINTPIQNQINGLETLANSIASDETKSYTYSDIVDLDVSGIEDIPKKELFKILFKKKKDEVTERSKYYNDILTAISFIAHIKENTRYNFDVFFNEFKNYEKQWNALIQKILDQKDIWTRSSINNQRGPDQDSFLRKFDEAVYHWAQEPERLRSQIVYNNLIAPLKEICKSYSLQDERAFSLLKNLFESEFIYKNIQNLRNIHANSFHQNVVDLQEKRNSLISAIAYFKKK